ncbi:MAG: ABC transporter substrate-binding protein [Promethearchaeota archaeon]
MEALTKRIIAIVLIAAIGTGIGIGAWFFLAAPGAVTNPYIYPGFEPEQKPLSQTLKMGLLDDMSWSGLGAWQGAYIAARRINLAGGVDIGGTTYYIGLVVEDTKEAAYDFESAKAAANTMIGHAPHACFGGFRSEVFSGIQDIIMGAKIPFMITGTATEDWCKLRIGSAYDFYKYTFRVMPLNDGRMGTIIGNFLTTRIMPNISAHIGYPIKNVTIVYENLMWTARVKAEIEKVLLAHDNTTAFFSEVIPAGGLAYDFDTLWARLSTGSSKTHLIIPIISDPAVGVQFGRKYNIYQPEALVAGINVLCQFGPYTYPEATWSETEQKYGGMYEITSHGFAFVNLTSGTLPFLEEFVAEYGVYPIYTTFGANEAVNMIAYIASTYNTLDADQIVTHLEAINMSNPYQGLNNLYAFDEYHDYIPTDGTPAMLGYPENIFRQWQPLNGSNPYQRYYYSAPILPGWASGEPWAFWDDYTGPLDAGTYPTIGGKPLIAYKNRLIFPHWW